MELYLRLRAELPIVRALHAAARSGRVARGEKKGASGDAIDLQEDQGQPRRGNPRSPSPTLTNDFPREPAHWEGIQGVRRIAQEGIGCRDFIPFHMIFRLAMGEYCSSSGTILMTCMHPFVSAMRLKIEKCLLSFEQIVVLKYHGSFSENITRLGRTKVRSCVAHVKESWVQCWNAITSTVLKCTLTQPQARNTTADNENTKEPKSTEYPLRM
uniref:Uncharacterized protein n=1 Tax=Oryza meridionalis TaxID=40149 RepID=A0A0E0FCW4_9ORYZ